MIKRAYEGMRIRAIGWDNSGVPHGTLGTVAKVATVGGKSIYPDPCRKMIFAHWDNGMKVGVFKFEAEQVHA
jgi:hypothetical protein